jgi:hypothetical protein
MAKAFRIDAIGEDTERDESTVLKLPIKLRPRGVEAKLVIGSSANPTGKRDAKASRMAVASAKFEAGQALLPERATWLPDLEAELFVFPAAGTMISATQSAKRFWTKIFLSWRGYHPTVKVVEDGGVAVVDLRTGNL